MRRRNYQPRQRFEKPFIHTYHINEVPLPYYNPLQDPYLRGFFSNRKVTDHITNMGFIYSPQKEYPYHQRRHKNAHKHLKGNLCKVPAEHIIKHKEFQSKSCVFEPQKIDLLDSEEKFFRSMPKRKSGSEIINKVGNKFANLSDLLQKSNTFSDRRRNLSPQIRAAKGPVFRRRNSSASRRENAQEEVLE